MRSRSLSLVPSIRDPRGPHLPVWAWLERTLARRLVDARDAILVQQILISALFVPLAALLYVPGVFSWVLGIAYVALLVPRLGPNAIRVHLLSHRPLFKRG